MIGRKVLGCGALVFALLGGTALAQPGNRYLIMTARVLDLVFPLDVEPKPYALRLVLRFGDSDSQIVAVVYPGGKSEIIQYTLGGMGGGGLWRLIERMMAENPNVTDREIAAKLKAEVTRSPIDYADLAPSLRRLEAIRMSPVLGSRVALGAYEYEYRCDTWQESVRYTVASPFGKTPEDKLARWMEEFRTNLPNLLARPSPPKP
jgi:hypothetical protein